MYCVYHLIHVQTPHRHIPKLVITKVPPGATLDWETIERAGYRFSEFNVDRANHLICQVDARESPADLVSRIRAGEGQWTTYADLVARAFAPLE